ncbi:MAG: hypothetical protein HQL64_00365 [Magnetococcales bacterium]|nr:hypothetical protein [Magnetococcales bacterium]
MGLTKLMSLLVFAAGLSGCAVMAVTDAAVTVASTAVGAGAKVVGTTVDVATSGVKALTRSSDDEKKKE